MGTGGEANSRLFVDVLKPRQESSIALPRCLTWIGHELEELEQEGIPVDAECAPENFATEIQKKLELTLVPHARWLASYRDGVVGFL